MYLLLTQVVDLCRYGPWFLESITAPWICLGCWSEIGCNLRRSLIHLAEPEPTQYWECGVKYRSAGAWLNHGRKVPSAKHPVFCKTYCTISQPRCWKTDTRPETSDPTFICISGQHMTCAHKSRNWVTTYIKISIICVCIERWFQWSNLYISNLNRFRVIAKSGIIWPNSVRERIAHRFCQTSSRRGWFTKSERAAFTYTFWAKSATFWRYCQSTVARVMLNTSPESARDCDSDETKDFEFGRAIRL